MLDANPFIVFACVLALVSAGGVIFATRPVYAAIALLVHSLVLAGLYALLAADLVAIGQMLIYSGAVVVLFIFVIALLPMGGEEVAAGPGRIAAALLAGAVLLVALTAAFSGGAPAVVAAAPGGVVPVARALFGSLLWSFELTAPLLLVAIVGAVVLWKRHGEAV